MSTVTRSLKLAEVDGRDSAINTHAFEAVASFGEALRENHRRLGDGWKIYEDQAEELFNTAQAAMLFLSADMAAKVEPFLAARECMGDALDDADDDAFGRRYAIQFIAKSMVVALLGAPQEKKP